MSGDIFAQVKTALQGRMTRVVSELLPGGKVMGQEYVCASLQGGEGESCRTNLSNGRGSDFATGERWGDVISLAAKVWQMGQYQAAQEMARRYGISLDKPWPASQPAAMFTAITPVPRIASSPPQQHPKYGPATACWRYADIHNRTLGYILRFERHQGGKIIAPLSYGQMADSPPQWHWRSLPAPRPLYGLPGLVDKASAPVLLVEGEKTADAAQKLFPGYAVLSWSGGAKAISKSDFSPLSKRRVFIWPDNDQPGFAAASELAGLLQNQAQSVAIVMPPSHLPEKWDLADNPDFDVKACLASTLSLADFQRQVYARYNPNPSSTSANIAISNSPTIINIEDIENTELNLKAWPRLSAQALPGIAGDFVRLATRDSEADPAAVLATFLVRFGAEVYGFQASQGPYIYVGETIHPPRLFAVICGNTSKARKGTSRHPVSKLFRREANPEGIVYMPLPARESGGPLSTGEGLAYHVRDGTADEKRKATACQELRSPDDKRLMIQDEEFASALACTRREGNTLSMGIRCFWDSGDYAPLTKNNPVSVNGAHICIVTHITMQELAIALSDVQAVNGFGNRFLWICARRSKLVPLPAPMPYHELRSIQKELWRLVALAQGQGVVGFSKPARELWDSVYPALSQEHPGLAGGIINRSEAQTLRLALIYALLDGQGRIERTHLQAALALWRYAQDSALYIFGDRAANPLEDKILRALQDGPLSATELSACLNRHASKEQLQPLLQQLEARRRISISKKTNGGGRPKTIIALTALSEKSELSEERHLLS